MRKRLKRRAGEAVVLLAVGYTLAPVVTAGVFIIWMGMTHYLAARELVRGHDFEA